jgi:hypothetical protein
MPSGWRLSMPDLGMVKEPIVAKAKASHARPLVVGA